MVRPRLSVFSKFPRTALSVPLAVLAAMLSVTPPVAAQPAPSPPANAARVDPVFLAAQKAFEALPVEARQAIQHDLIWAGTFSASASGDFGPLTFAAIRKFESDNKFDANGILNPTERERLLTIANSLRRATGFAALSDPVSGISLAVPGAVLTNRVPNASGGSRWQDKEQKFTLDTHVYKPEDTLESLFERGTGMQVQGRKITYKILRPEFFVISGETATGKFYRRVEKGPNGALRGMSVGYAKEGAADFDRYVIAIAAQFRPFGKPDATQAQSGPATARPSALKLETSLKPQASATGLMIAPGKIISAEAGVKACKSLRLAGGTQEIGKPPEAKAGLVMLSSAAIRAEAFSLHTGDLPLDVLVIHKNAEGEVVASPAQIAPGDVPMVSTALQGGGAGAVILSRSGGLIGMITGDPAQKRMIAGVVPAARYPFAPAQAMLSMAGVSPGKTETGPDMTIGAISQSFGARLVTILCGL